MSPSSPRKLTRIHRSGSAKEVTDLSRDISEILSVESAFWTSARVSAYFMRRWVAGGAGGLLVASPRFCTRFCHRRLVGRGLLGSLACRWPSLLSLPAMLLLLAACSAAAGPAGRRGEPGTGLAVGWLVVAGQAQEVWPSTAGPRLGRLGRLGLRHSSAARSGSVAGPGSGRAWGFLSSALACPAQPTARLFVKTLF